MYLYHLLSRILLCCHSDITDTGGLTYEWFEYSIYNLQEIHFLSFPEK